jgi:hypothetical protein
MDLAVLRLLNLPHAPVCLLPYGQVGEQLLGAYQNRKRERHPNLLPLAADGANTP